MPHIPSGYAEITYIISLLNDPEDMTFSVGAAMGAAPSGAQLAAISQAWATPFDTVLTNQATYQGVKVLHNAGGVLTEHEFVVANVGNQTSSVLPSNCALLVQKRTGLVGRRHRGRCFIPGVLQELEVDATGQISTAHHADLQTRAEDWRVALEVTANTGITDVVVLHSTAALGNPTPVSGFVVDDVIATQRRRMRA